MDEMDQIYNEMIMEHSMSNKNRKSLEKPTSCLLGHNPNCGDEIKLEILVKDGKIADAAFSGHGCAISQSSTSIMIDTIKGKTVEEAKKIIEINIKMIKREKLSSKEKSMLGDARAFENISNMPARVKCAVLSWHTMQDLLNKWHFCLK